MNRIFLPLSLTDELRSVSRPSEIFDASGNKLGTFMPDEYVGHECPTPLEELDRIEKQGGGRPLADILRNLERQA
jgi:hypothetical protein